MGCVTFKSLMACSVTNSSFLFHSTELITLNQMSPIIVCSEMLFFLISSRMWAMICKTSRSQMENMLLAEQANHGLHMLKLITYHLLPQGWGVKALGAKTRLHEQRILSLDRKQEDEMHNTHSCFTSETLFVRRWWLYFLMMRKLKDSQINVKENF